MSPIGLGLAAGADSESFASDALGLSAGGAITELGAVGSVGSIRDSLASGAVGLQAKTVIFQFARMGGSNKLSFGKAFPRFP